MSVQNLDLILHPRSVALIGASPREGSLGRVVLDNVVKGGFPGETFAVNPHRIDLDGVCWHPTISSLPHAPDLAIIMTPAGAVPDAVTELGRIGTKVAVVITAGLDDASGLRTKTRHAACDAGVRLIGPNCLGLLMPHAGLNASFAHIGARPGRLALISQSGALVTAFLDWAAPRDIGFSGIVSAGDMLDADIGDFIDLFATHPGTDAILLYIEGITDAAKFMSAASAAARSKPVIAIKAGRTDEARQAARSHSGALAGSYPVYSAAFERAGIIQVESLRELFDAAEVLCRSKPLQADRVAVITNGGGAAVLAVDHLKRYGASIARLSAETVAALDQSLPPNWSHGNPVDIIGDGGAERYRTAFRAVLADTGVDAVIVMHCPTALASSQTIAETLAAEVTAADSTKPVLACWLGDANADLARAILAGAGIPLFSTPDDGARAFGYLLAAGRARAMLTERVAPRRAAQIDRTAARSIITEARARRRTALSEVDTKTLLAAYGVPVVATRFAPRPADIVEACSGLSGPFAVKLVSPDLIHKSDVGGVALGLSKPADAAAAALRIDQQVRREHPEARIDGYVVEPMCIRPHSIELLLGIAQDAAFGPVLLFGAGGKAVEAMNDRVIGLPPLDHDKARAMIGKTRISRLLNGYRDVPPADLSAIADVLVALSELAADLPDIVELDINPLLADAHGVIALDARAIITEQADPAGRMAIRAVPREWAADVRIRSGVVLHVRPAVPADEAALAEFFAHVTPEDLRFRFLSSLARVSHEQLSQMVHVDYRRSISFLAIEPSGTIVAAALLVTDPDRKRAEIAMSTRPDWKGRGASYSLLQHLLRYAEAQRIQMIEAVEFADHEEALRMERELGFTAVACPDDPTIRIVRRMLDC